MNDKPLPDDFYEDLKWEIEADKAWDDYFMQHGIDRNAMVRDYLDALTPWWKQLLNRILRRYLNR